MQSCDDRVVLDFRIEISTTTTNTGRVILPGQVQAVPPKQTWGQKPGRVLRIDMDTTRRGRANEGDAITTTTPRAPLPSPSGGGGDGGISGYRISDEDAAAAEHQRLTTSSSSPGRGTCRPPPPVVMMTQATTTAAKRPRYTARAIVGVFSVMLSIALLGLGIKMSVAYDDAPLIHVSVAFVGFTAATSTTWQACEFVAKCARQDRRGIYPGTHVGVHICLCLACVATMGYVCFWVSQGDRWKYVEVHGEQTAYSPLYHMGIVVVILTSMLLLVHFIMSILACQELRRKDDDDEPYRTVVRVRYDGVGPDGTARPLSYQVPAGSIGLPAYSARSSLGRTSRPVSMTREVTPGADGVSSPAVNMASPRTQEKSGDQAA